MMGKVQFLLSHWGIFRGSFTEMFTDFILILSKLLNLIGCGHKMLTFHVTNIYHVHLSKLPTVHFNFIDFL